MNWNKVAGANVHLKTLPGKLPVARASLDAGSARYSIERLGRGLFACGRQGAETNSAAG